MEKDTALTIFNALEEQKYAWVLEDIHGNTGITGPTFNVRLDAGTNNDQERTYSLFVRIDPDALAMEELDNRDSLLYVLELCAEYGATPELQNAGIELT